jgi:hypothetical protein
MSGLGTVPDWRPQRAPPADRWTGGKASGICSNEVSESLTSAQKLMPTNHRATVAQELENGLVVVNDDFALLEGPLNEIHPGGAGRL